MATEKDVSDLIEEIIEDEDSIITVSTEDGKNRDFVKIADIVLDGNLYAILQPVEPFEDVEENEVLIFKVVKDENGEDDFEIELDNSVIDEVFAEFKKFVEENEEQDEEEIITLTSDDGVDIDFIKIADIILNGNLYSILQPIEPFEGMEEDEALVFKVVKDENGEQRYDIEIDNSVIDEVFAEYDKMVEEKEETDA